MNRFREFFRTQLAKPLTAVGLALIIGALLLWLAGYDVPKAYFALANAAFFDYHYVADGLLKTTPLILLGAGVAFAFKANVFNIGAEGQMYIGALAATWFATRLDWPGFALLPLIILAGAIGGGLWAALPGYLKARLGVSEVITTIMMNYIAIELTGLLLSGPLQELDRVYPRSDPILAGARLPFILPGTRLHLGFLLAILLAVGLSYLLLRTVFGYEARAVGLSPTAARTSGVNVQATILKTMLVSGGLAGIAGAVELSGVTHQMFKHFSAGQGYDAIAVALVAGNSPIGVIFSGWLFGVMRAGSNLMQRSAGVSWSFVYVFQALVVVFIAISGHLKVREWLAALKGGMARG
ncbi:MAG: ABC transporter permease [Bacillota bacterium]